MTAPVDRDREELAAALVGRPGSYVRLPNGTTWPNPVDPAEVEWRLRYGTPTRSDILVAASTMAAYRALVEGPPRLRAELRAAALNPEGNDHA
jgi:hypothetical protein